MLTIDSFFFISLLEQADEKESKKMNWYLIELMFEDEKYLEDIVQ